MSSPDMETRPLVLKAFRALRKAGYIARANYTCCATCASAACFDEAEEKSKKGVVWWHKQDDENYRKTGDLYLGFGAVEDVDESTNSDAVGRDICKALTDAGLEFRWDGDSMHRILVVGKSKKSPGEPT